MLSAHIHGRAPRLRSIVLEAPELSPFVFISLEHEVEAAVDAKRQQQLVNNRSSWVLIRDYHDHEKHISAGRPDEVSRFRMPRIFPRPAFNAPVLVPQL